MKFGLVWHGYSGKLVEMPCTWNSYSEAMHAAMMLNNGCNAKGQYMVRMIEKEDVKMFDDFTTQIQSDELAAVYGYDEQMLAWQEAMAEDFEG